VYRTHNINVVACRAYTIRLARQLVAWQLCDLLYCYRRRSEIVSMLTVGHIRVGCENEDVPVFGKGRERMGTTAKCGKKLVRVCESIGSKTC